MVLQELPCIGLSWPLTKPPFGSCAIYFHYGVLQVFNHVHFATHLHHLFKRDYLKRICPAGIVPCRTISSWQPLGKTLLQVKLLVGYMRNCLCHVGTVNSIPRSTQRSERSPAEMCQVLVVKYSAGSTPSMRFRQPTIPRIQVSHEKKHSDT